MTLNQIINRVRTLALAHKQIRRFTLSLETDFFTDHTAKYPACCLQYITGNISISAAATSITFRLYLLDLVHVSQDTKENQDDVLSDTLSIVTDLVASINNSNYSDWRVSTDNQLTPLIEYDNDLPAGWHIDFTISTKFTQDLCAIPTDDIPITPTDTDMKLVYDVKYIADGTEGLVLTPPPEVHGKKILLITRESSPIYRVSSAPDFAEFTWDNNIVGLGVPTNPNERFLFLYRIY